jgi:hypothetical protein
MRIIWTQRKPPNCFAHVSSPLAFPCNISLIPASKLSLETEPVQLELNTGGKGQCDSIQTSITQLLSLPVCSMCSIFSYFTHTSSRRLLILAVTGSYLFTVDREVKRLNLVSPMSGGHSYLFDEEQQLWLSASDDRWGTSCHFLSHHGMRRLFVSLQ